MYSTKVCYPKSSTTSYVAIVPLHCRDLAEELFLGCLAGPWLA